MTEHRPANRLIHETSPYLLQHAHNPVDWRPWGDEAFAEARARDCPILLSVGYATCHWCHVMERESFEDPMVAAQLADGFLAIKVDREELPDVDHVYMSALQALTGQGGWPMNMFLTPELAPFHGGTYYPPVRRGGMPSFRELLAAVRHAWTTQREQVEQQARSLVEHVRDGTRLPPRDPGPDVQRQAVAELAQRFDAEFGGFGGAPKFPQSPLLQWLLLRGSLGDDDAAAMLATTLHAMAAGGIHDHLSGGFARYSTDARWHVPHFEKMLFDNAQLARLYTGAHRLSGDARLREVAEATLGWMLDEMRPAAAPQAFASAQDADAEGVEGRFHVWSGDEFDAVLGADAGAAAALYGVRAEGNWEHGMNVLERRTPEAVRTSLGLDDAGFAAWEASVRERLLAARARRVRPITDDKVLADWNGLALRALAEAGRLLGRPGWVDAARELAEFLLLTMRRDGLVLHAWRNGRLRDEAFLSDQAQVGLGLLELHQATGEPRWLTEARDLADALVARFHDDEGFVDAVNGPLPLRARDLLDGAVPSGTAAACELLLRLAGPFDRPDWRDLVERTLQRHGALLEQAPMAVPGLLLAHVLAEHGAELAIPQGSGSAALRAVAQSAFAPAITAVHAPPGALPLLEGRSAGAAYLCRHGACRLPATTAEALRQQLDAAAAR